MQLIDGNAVSAEYKAQIKTQIAEMKRKPALTAVLVGDDPASETYVNRKRKTCEELGIRSEVIRLSKDTTQDELISQVKKLNCDPQVDGFIVQMPLPKHISEQSIIEAIDPCKDVDGFHPLNVGRMSLGLETFIPATPLGILQLLKHYKIETAGKNCVIIGRSNIVGRPLADLLSQRGWDCTVTLCHSKTKDLNQVCRGADILIAAIGIPEFVTANMVKEGAVVIDVGITSVKSDKTKSGWQLRGDVKFDEVAPKTSYITPVPGGVGPMTIMGLIHNTLMAARRGCL